MAPPSVLLVDDQRDIVRLLHSSLQTLGHELEIIDAPSGEEALLEASLRRIDLLVADYLLPGISGVELMHKIRLRNRCQRCGRPRGYIRKYALCRICFRELALQGIIPGVVKSSW